MLYVVILLDILLENLSAHSALADSPLLQWFTKASEFGKHKGMSKSSLERFEQCCAGDLMVQEIKELINNLSSAAGAANIG